MAGMVVSSSSVRESTLLLCWLSCEWTHHDHQPSLAGYLLLSCHSGSIDIVVVPSTVDCGGHI